MLYLPDAGDNLKLEVGATLLSSMTCNRFVNRHGRNVVTTAFIKARVCFVKQFYVVNAAKYCRDYILYVLRQSIRKMLRE